MQNVLSTKLYHTKSLNYKTSSLTYHVARYKGPHTKRLSAQLPHTKMLPKQKKGLMQNVRKKSKTFPKQQNVSRTKKVRSTKHPIILYITSAFGGHKASLVNLEKLCKYKFYLCFSSFNSFCLCTSYVLCNIRHFKKYELYNLIF